ncbi:MAG: hypothetical protein QME49_10130, partial [bacterium]|nr:hypothetical protein [bacterium]
VGNNNAMGWVGSASIPAGVDSMGTVSIFATDIYNQQAAFIGTLTIDTTPPDIPTIAATYTVRDGWLVYGTATGAVEVKLRQDNNNVSLGTAILSVDGAFRFTLGTVAGSITVHAISIDQAGNRTPSDPLNIPAPMWLSAKLPPLIATMLDVRGMANQPLGTISGKLVYGTISAALSMAVGKGVTVGNNNAMGWVGSASIPAGVDSMGTV